MRLVGKVNNVTKQQGLMGLQEHDLVMADENFSGKTIKIHACWTKRLGQVSKYHLKDSENAKTMNSKNFVAVALRV